MIKLLKVLALCICTALMFVIAFRLRFDRYFLGQIPLADFDIYYHTVQDLWQGKQLSQLPYMQTSGPPSVIIPFIPFALFPLQLARSFEFILNLGAVFLSAYLLAKKFWPRFLITASFILATLFLLAFPTRFALNLGQPAPLIMLLVTLIITSTGSGIAAGLLILLKTNFVFLLTAWRKRPALKWAFGTLLVSVALGLVVIRPTEYLHFIQTKLSPSFTQSASLPHVDYYNQSIKSTLARLSLAGTYTMVYPIILLVALGYLFITGDTISGILISLLLSPIIWQHYFPAVYPILILTGWQVRQNNRLLVLTGIAAGLTAVQFSRIHGLPINPLNGLIASHYFWGLCLLLAIRIKLQHVPN